MFFFGSWKRILENELLEHWFFRTQGPFWPPFLTNPALHWHLFKIHCIMHHFGSWLLQLGSQATNLKMPQTWNSSTSCIYRCLKTSVKKRFKGRVRLEKIYFIFVYGVIHIYVIRLGRREGVSEMIMGERGRGRVVIT
jgi:hypothetical protein